MRSLIILIALLVAPFDSAHPSTSLGMTLSLSKGQDRPPQDPAATRGPISSNW